MKSTRITLPKTVKRAWFEIDASSNSLGRVASEVAKLLRGKHKRDFTPHMDMGDFVVVKNADNLKFTGRKVEQKQYFHHSGYLGGLKTTSLKVMLQRKPEDVLKKAVFSMLDEVKFRKAMMARLKVVKGDTHSYKIDKVL
jgi:large subunit ribosomal protein L13